MPIITVYAPITGTYGSNGPGLCKRIRRVELRYTRPSRGRAGPDSQAGCGTATVPVKYAAPAQLLAGGRRRRLGDSMRPSEPALPRTPPASRSSDFGR